MDNTDLKIIELLRQNSRASTSAIARQIHLSVPAAAERIRRLEERGVLAFTVRVNREAFGLNLQAYIFVTLEKPQHIPAFREAVQGCPVVLECHHIAGEYDYLLKVAVKDTGGLEEFISGTVKSVDGVLRTNTLIVLSSVKEA